MPSGTIVLAGGSGFLGRTLARWFGDRGCEIVVLTRQPEGCWMGRPVAWDARTLGDWVGAIEGAAALINLAGRSVNCRYNARNRRAMMDSRVLSTRVLGEAVGACTNPPRAWLNSSTATIYKHTYGDVHDESGAIGATPEAKDAFSVEVAEAWEEAFDQAETPSTRKIVLRTAMVFGNEAGGVYTVLRRLARMGLGGKMAHGGQYVSWIHETDFCRAIEWLIRNERASGVYNICAPNPVTNAAMMSLLRRQFRRPIGLPATRWMLEIGVFFLRTETELVIKSRRVVPGRLLEEGFSFAFPEMRSAIASLEGEMSARKAAQSVL